MGHHLTDEGDFKSDKYPWCPEGFFALKVSDPVAQACMLFYAELTSEAELAGDLRQVVRRHRLLANESCQLREYVELLHEQISRLTGIAYAHGWRGDKDLHRKAQPLRDALGYNEKDSNLEDDTPTETDEQVQEELDEISEEGDFTPWEDVKAELNKPEIQPWMEAITRGVSPEQRACLLADIQKHYAARKVPYRYDTKRIGDCLQITGKAVPEAALALAAEALSYRPETEQEEWLARNLAPVFHHIAEAEAQRDELREDLERCRLLRQRMARALAHRPNDEQGAAVVASPKGPKPELEEKP